MSRVFRQTSTGYLLCARLLERLTGEQYDTAYPAQQPCPMPAHLPHGLEDRREGQCFLLALGLAWRVCLTWQALDSFVSPKVHRVAARPCCSSPQRQADAIRTEAEGHRGSTDHAPPGHASAGWASTFSACHNFCQFGGGDSSGSR